MIPPTSLDLIVKAQSMALLGIAEWLSQQPDVPKSVLSSLLQVLTTVPILVGCDLGPEMEREMKERANTVLERIVGSAPL